MDCSSSVKTQKEVTMSTVLVVGATGMLGSAICQRLVDAGKSVRALVRVSSDPAKVEKLKALGIETVEGNVHDRASLDRACQHMDAVISTVSSMPFSYQPDMNNIQNTDVEGVTNLIEAAVANHVSHFIYTSFSDNIQVDFPLNNAKREVERCLMESGLAYTILRPSYFMEVWLGPAVGFDAANGKVVIYGTGENPVSWIALQDVVEFAVAALDHPAAKNAILELGGPQMLTPLEVVKLFEDASGRTMEWQFVPEAALEAQQAAATDPMQQSFSGLMRCLASGDPIEMANTLESFAAISPTTVEEYARRTMTKA
jgi:uncharacterized protein YbjT (DUF2867 family)